MLCLQLHSKSRKFYEVFGLLSTFENNWKQTGFFRGELVPDTIDRSEERFLSKRDERTIGNMSPQNLLQYFQQYVVFLMPFGKQIFSRTSELDCCGCCLFHSKKQYVIESCHFLIIMRLLYFYLKSYLITSLSAFWSRSHCVQDVSKVNQ